MNTHNPQSASAVAPALLRLFVAIPVPDVIRSKLSHTQSELRQILSPGAIRWTRADQMHLTLRFLGRVESGRVPELVQNLRTACAGFEPLQLRCAGIGFFPNRRRMRVLWAGVDDAGAHLLRVQSAVAQAVESFSAEAPEKSFAAHVTLGRAKQLSRADADQLSGMAPDLVNRRFGGWMAGGVELIQSRLDSAGSIYTTLDHAPFASARTG